MVKCSLPCVSICAVWVSMFVHCTRVSGPTQRKRKCHHGSVKKSWAVPAYLSSWRLRWKYGRCLYLHLYLRLHLQRKAWTRPTCLLVASLHNSILIAIQLLELMTIIGLTHQMDLYKRLYIDCCVVNSSLWGVSLVFWRSLLTRIL